MKRDFVATAYIIEGKKILHVFHKKHQKWVSPGGHLDPNELPHEGAIREAFEETGIKIRIISPNTDFITGECAQTLPPPFTMLLEEIPEYKNIPAHQHIDFIFMAEAVEGNLSENPAETEGIGWFTLEQIEELVREGKAFSESLKIAESMLEQLALR